MPNPEKCSPLLGRRIDEEARFVFRNLLRLEVQFRRWRFYPEDPKSLCGLAGDREAGSNSLSVRTRSGEDLKTMSLEEFTARLTNEIEHKL